MKTVGLNLKLPTMCSNRKVNAHMIFDYEERKQSLLSDGYRLRHETTLCDGVICRLHHMCNGNDILLVARGSRLYQKTNHVITHDASY